MRTIILGPPGTGKTRTLLKLVEDYLNKGTPPNRIGYFAFTKKAANEALSRAMLKFGLDEDDLPYFRTLHSLAFRSLGISRNRVMKKFHYQDLGKKLGFSVDYASYQDDFGGYFSSNSDYLNLISLAKVRGITVEEQFDLNEHDSDIERDKLKIIANELETYKKEIGLVDFTDMIQKFIEKDVAPSFDVIFIDEAQDLSFLQWKMVKQIWEKTKQVYIAGDDDQAIFRWAGADIDSFIALPGKTIVLDQSHRVPSGDIHNLSIGLANRISNRRSKTWKPNTNEGLLRFHGDVYQVDMSSGDWLVLARTKYLLENTKDLCEERGWFYGFKNETSVDAETLKAINDWEHLRQGQMVDYDSIKNLYNYLSSNKVDKIHKTGKTLLKDQMYTLEDCTNKYGLKTKDIWYDALDDIDFKTREYIRAMRRNGELLKKEPRIKLSTIHGMKGGECNNVVLLSDLTENTLRNYEKNPDDENRLFYVGATRAKQQLHIVEPKSYEMSYPL